MAKRPTIKNISAGYTSTTTLNENFEALRDAFDNTISRDGSLPNTMSADLDLNGNDITNVNTITDSSGGDLVQDARDAKVGAEAAKTAAESARDAAQTAQTGAETAYNSVQPYLDEIDTVASDLTAGSFVAGSEYDFGSITAATTGTSGSPDGFILGVYNNLDDIGTVAGNNANITTVAGISAEVTSVAGNEANIATVGTISADITSVAGISANVTTVAGNTANINAVAADATDIGTVSANISSVNTVATNIADVITVANDLNEAISEIETAANDLNEVTSEIDTVANSIANVDTVGTNITNVNTVAGVSSDVTTVAGISADTTTVAGISANVTSVAGNSTNINAVVANETNINAVSANSSNINAVNANSSNINAVSTNSANINTVAGDTTAINTVAGDTAAINTAATDSAVINTVAGISADVTATAGKATEIGRLGTAAAVADLAILGTTDAVADMNVLAAIDTAIQTVSGISANVSTVAGISSSVSTLALINSDVTTVSGISSNVTTVAGIASDVTAVAADASDIGTVSTNIANVNAVAGNSVNINAVAGNATNINIVAADAADIGTVATNIANVNAVGGDISNVNTVATNLTSVNSFAEQYRVGATEPTTSLDTGDLFYDTTSGTLKVYNGTGWEQGVTAGSGFLPLSGGTLTGALSLPADPTNPLQVATKQYVDTIAAAGIHYHTPVRVESPVNLNATYNNGSSGVGATLTNAGTNAAITIDGVTLSLNDRVLVYQQTNAAHNGIYTVTTVGDGSTAWVLTRATDADSYGVSDPDAFGEGDAFFVKEGVTGAGELYVMNTSGAITFGTTAITFTVIAETAVYSAGDSLTLTGTTFDTVQDIRTTASPTFNNITVTGTVDGRDVAADGTKLDGIEAGATGDQTAAEIRTLVESATDSNVFTDADHTKLNGIEAGANVTDAGNVNPLIDSHLNVSGASSGQYLGWNGSDYAWSTVDLSTKLNLSGGTMTGAINFVAGQTFDGRDVSADGAKLDGIEANAKDDQTITAGSGLTGGGTGNVTLSHADTSSQASVNNSGATVIQDVTVDTYGHVTGLGSKTLSYSDVGAQVAGTYNTIIGTDSDINTSGSTIIDNIYVTDGVITSMGTRTLTLADLGYTGATNANYITNNNQLTNGAGYTTFTANQSLNTNSSVTFSTVTATDFNSTSDASLKTNVETLTGSLDKVKALRGVSFDWKATSVPDIGLIAQEVEEVLPELVNINDNGIKSVKYSNIVGVLIEAIKEQQVQIDALKEKLGE